MKKKVYSYRIQHACFECRKVFKFDYLTREQQRRAWLSHRISGRCPTLKFVENPHSCPQCSKPVHMMGRAFRAPKLDDVDAWKAAELLFLAGYRFWSLVGQLPTTAKKAREFLALRPPKTAGERLAQRIKATHS